MIVFSNCHGEKYLKLIKEYTNVYREFNVKYIVSYNALSDFSKYISDFRNADLVIMNNIKNYKDYTISNLRTILKQTAKIIIIPYVRYSLIRLFVYKSFFNNFFIFTLDSELSTKCISIHRYLTPNHPIVSTISKVIENITKNTDILEKI
jgi:hypothetical protein